MPATRQSAVESPDDDIGEISSQVIVESEAGPSRHPLRSKKPRQNLPYARNQKKNTRKPSEEEQSGFFSSVKSILSLKWLRNSPAKLTTTPAVNSQDKSDSDSEQSDNMDSADVDRVHEKPDESMEIPRESTRSRKDLVIDSGKGKKSTSNGSTESLYPRVPSFDSSIVTPLRAATLPVAEATEAASSKTENDADIIEYVRRIGRESLAKKKVVLSDDLYASKSPFRFAKQRSQASTRTPNKAFGAGLNSVGRRPFSQNLSPGSPGSEQQTKRRKTVEQRTGESVERLGTPQFPFTPSEARRIMENIESMSSPFSEAKRTSTTSSSLRKSVSKKSILLDDDIAPPTKALSVPLSLPGLPYSKGRRATSKAPSRLSEVSEFLSSVNEKKKQIAEKLEAQKSVEPDTAGSSTVLSADEASTKEATPNDKENTSMKSDFSFGAPVALSDIQAPPLPIEFKRTEVEKPADSAHTLKKYSLKMKGFTTRQHGTSNRFSARDEDLDSEGEEDEALKTVAPAPLLGASDGFSFGTPKPSVAASTVITNPPVAASKFSLGDIAKDSDKKATETVATSLQSPQNAEVKSKLSGFSFGSPGPSKPNEDVSADQPKALSSAETPKAIPSLTKPSGFSFGIAAVDKTAEEKPEVKSGFSFGNVEKSEKPSGFSFGSSLAASTAAESQTPAAKDKEAPSTSKFSFGTLESKSLETTPASKSGFSFGSLAADEPKTPSLFAGTAAKSDLSSQEDGEKSDGNKEKPMPAFSFGASTNLETSKPATSSEEPKSTPAFTFGTPSTSEKPLGFGSQLSASSTATAETSPNTASSFAFGDKSEVKKDASAINNAAIPEKSESKSTGFSFGLPSTSQAEPKVDGFTFGGASTPLATKPDSATTSFSFGTKESSTTPTSDVKPAFNFGANDSAAASKAESKPGFSFGASESTPASKDESKPSFSFGSVAAPAGQEAPKAGGFTFGGATTSAGQTESKSSGFTFDSGKTSDSKATGFSFGAATSTAQGSAVVADTSTPVSASTSFTFGAPAASTSTGTGFTFGASTTEPTKPSPFSFGASNTTSSETPKTTEESKPSFGGFGASTNTASTATTESKPSFTFGASTASASTPSFGGFGTFQPASTSADAKPSSTFTFGSSNSQSQPSGFTFGAPTSQTTTTFGATTQPQATPSPFTFGSSNSSDAMSSTPPTAFGGFGSNASTTTNTTSTSSAPFTFGGNNGAQTTPGFGFGASTTSQPSSVSFGSSNPPASTSSFTFGSSGNTGFGATTAQPQSQTPMFGGNSNAGFGAAQPAAAQPNSFAFGSGNNQAGSTPGGNFNFGAPSSQPAPFTFGSSTPAAPQANFGFGGTPAGGAPAATPGGFNMGTGTVPAGRKIARPKRRTR